MLFREITASDIPSLFVVRVATRENALSLEELARLGITEKSVRQRLATSHRGWLCEVAEQVVGFAMGDATTGEIWVIAVLPEWENRGIGGRLLDLVENELVAAGCRQFWLTTDVDPSLRAYGFYRAAGWIDHEIKDDMRYMRKSAPPPQ